MVWFKVDDNMPDHEKIRSIPRGIRCAAVGLWTLAGAWCSRHLKDGKLPAHMLDELSSKPALARALVDAGLWHTSGHDCEKCPEIPAGFYIFHDWRGSNPTKEKVEAKRAADRERLRKWREKQAGNDVTNGVGNTAPDPTRPDPTRPDPTRSTTSVEGERLVTLRSVDAPKPPQTWTTPSDARCTAHVGVADPPACNGCRKARETAAREAARDVEQQRRDAEARARDCIRCDGVNEIDPQTKAPTRRKCDHRKTA